MITKITAIAFLASITVLSTRAATNGTAFAKDWGREALAFTLNETSFGMTYAQVTNVNAEYATVAPPESELKTVSYLIVSVAEDKIPIGEMRPDVKLHVIKNVYFNQDNRVVAIEMVFSNLDLDKKTFVMRKLDQKYDVIPTEIKNVYRYHVYDNVEILCRVVETMYTENEFGRKIPQAFAVKNLYFHIPKYKEALKNAGKKSLPGELI